MAALSHGCEPSIPRYSGWDKSLPFTPVTETVESNILVYS